MSIHALSSLLMLVLVPSIACAALVPHPSPNSTANVFAASNTPASHEVGSVYPQRFSITVLLRKAANSTFDFRSVEPSSFSGRATDALFRLAAAARATAEHLASRAYDVATQARSVVNWRQQPTPEDTIFGLFHDLVVIDGSVPDGNTTEEVSTFSSDVISTFSASPVPSDMPIPSTSLNQSSQFPLDNGTSLEISINPTQSALNSQPLVLATPFQGQLRVRTEYTFEENAPDFFHNAFPKGNGPNGDNKVEENENYGSTKVGQQPLPSEVETQSAFETAESRSSQGYVSEESNSDPARIKAEPQHEASYPALGDVASKHDDSNAFAAGAPVSVVRPVQMHSQFSTDDRGYSDREAPSTSGRSNNLQLTEGDSSNEGFELHQRDITSHRAGQWGPRSAGHASFIGSYLDGMEHSEVSDENLGSETTGVRESDQPAAFANQRSSSGSTSSTWALSSENLTEGAGGMRSEDNTTQLSLMVYKIAKSERVKSMAAVPCREVAGWMPAVVQRLEANTDRFEFFCVDIAQDGRSMDDLRAAYGDVSGGYIQTSVEDISERFPKGIDLVVSWMGIQQWGVRDAWRFVKGLRRTGVRLCLLSNDAVQQNPNNNSGLLNVRKSPMLFNEPERIISRVSEDSRKQLLLYDMGKVRHNF